MKVLHLGIFDRQGGACIAAYRQHLALRRAGVDSAMWVRFKVTNDPQVQAFTPPAGLAARAKRILRRQILQRDHARFLRRGEFFDDRSEHGGGELKGLPSADVVNVQFAWEFIHWPALTRAIPEHMPLVVTMHEMASFTGGCSYTGGCARFQQQCGGCPLTDGGREVDLSRQSWLRKQAVYNRRRPGKIHFVADSHWLAAEARKSGLLAGKPVSVIHYGLDTATFRPLDRAFARDALQLPQDQPVVSFAAAAVDDARKGVRHLIEALRGLPRKPFLLTWGRNFPPALADIPHRHLGNIDNENFMALAYNAADVFVMPSLEEAFGQTALEAIACGTPVAAFGAGGLLDTVRHEQTGLLAKVGDSTDLRGAIARLLDDRLLWQRCSREGIRVAAAEFSMAKNARQYLELYESMLGESQPVAAVRP